VSLRARRAFAIPGAMRLFVLACAVLGGCGGSGVDCAAFSACGAL